MDEELTVMTAAEHRDRLCTALASGTGVRLDLSAVAEPDTAGPQVLVRARNEGERLGGPVEFADASPAVAVG